MSSEHPADDETLIRELARERGWTPRETEMVLAHVKAPLSGFKHCVVSAQLLLTMAQEEKNLALRAMYEIDPYSGQPMAGRFHESYIDYTSEGQEGERRRKWADTYRRNYVKMLKEARLNFAQAAFFEGLMAQAIPPVAAQVEDADEDEPDEDARLAKEQEAELQRRLHAVASESWEGTSKAKKRPVRNEARGGMKSVDNALAAAEAESKALAEQAGL